MLHGHAPRYVAANASPGSAKKKLAWHDHVGFRRGLHSGSWLHLLFFRFWVLFLELFGHFLHVCSLCVSKFPCVPKGIRKRKSIQITRDTLRLRHLRCTAITFKSYLVWFRSSFGPRNEELKDWRNSTLHRTMVTLFVTRLLPFWSRTDFNTTFKLLSLSTYISSDKA